ncbi:hypothetical protein HOY82DRAFT_535947 [Tuber indicum]|nr:hypothetical protein HOY82DRAFT_535947 [Tuber indicum]
MNTVTRAVTNKLCMGSLRGFHLSHKATADKEPPCQFPANPVGRYVSWKELLEFSTTQEKRLNAGVDKLRDELKKCDEKAVGVGAKLDSQWNSRFGELDSQWDSRFEKLNSQLNSQWDSRFEKLDSKLNSQFEKLDSKLDSQLDMFNTRFEGINTRFEGINTQLWCRSTKTSTGGQPDTKFLKCVITCSWEGKLEFSLVELLK